MYCCKRLGLLNSSCASMNQYAFLEVFTEGATIQDALHESSKVDCCNKSNKQIDFRYVIQKRTMTELTYNTEVQIVTLTPSNETSIHAACTDQ